MANKSSTKNQGRTQQAALAPLFEQLKARHRAERDAYAEPWASSFNLRIHRALSWLHKAELSGGDPDTQFLALWIGFNAAYAGAIGGQIEGRAVLAERVTFQGMLSKLCRIDEGGLLATMLWTRASGSVRSILDNEYIYQPFWDDMNGAMHAANWRKKFASDKLAAYAAVMAKDAPQVLSILFERLYVLRNQIMHGGATWKSSANREQLRNACKLLMGLLAIFIELMLNQPQEFDSPPFYPNIAI